MTGLLPPSQWQECWIASYLASDESKIDNYIGPHCISESFLFLLSSLINSVESWHLFAFISASLYPSSTHFFVPAAIKLSYAFLKQSALFVSSNVVHSGNNEPSLILLIHRGSADEDLGSDGIHPAFKRFTSSLIVAFSNFRALFSVSRERILVSRDWTCVVLSSFQSIVQDDRKTREMRMNNENFIIRNARKSSEKYW